VQRRLDKNPQAMRQRRETVEHPFGTMKARMGATHFLTKTLPKVAAERALSVLAYNLTRVMNILGIKPLIAASWPEARAPLGLRHRRPSRPFLHDQDPTRTYSKSKCLQRRSAAVPISPIHVCLARHTRGPYRNLGSMRASDNLIRGLKTLPYADRIRE
jgi:DDE family transposase